MKGDLGSIILKEIVNSLDVKVTNQAINSTNERKHLDVSTLSNSLFDWNIESLVVKIDSIQLSEIPYPAIAHLNKNHGHFVVLKQFANRLASASEF